MQLKMHLTHFRSVISSYSCSLYLLNRTVLNHKPNVIVWETLFTLIWHDALCKCGVKPKVYSFTTLTDLFSLSPFPIGALTLYTAGVGHMAAMMDGPLQTQQWYNYSCPPSLSAPCSASALFTKKRLITQTADHFNKARPCFCLESGSGAQSTPAK